MSDNPDIDVVNNAINETPAPEMPLPESTVVTLIRGFDGVNTGAQVRELDGEDEEFLAGSEATPGIGYSEHMTAILSRGVTTIGGQPILNTKDLDKLIDADRNILMLAITKATYGGEKKLRTSCPHCSKQNDIVVDLDEDFPITWPNFDITRPIAVVTPKTTLYFNLPTGEILSAAAKEKNVQMANSLVLSKCAVFTNNEPGDRLQWARKLSAAVRRSCTDALLAVELGPKLTEVKTQCAHCDQEMIIGLDWVSLLLN